MKSASSLYRKSTCEHSSAIRCDSAVIFGEEQSNLRQGNDLKSNSNLISTNINDVFTGAGRVPNECLTSPPLSVATLPLLARVSFPLCRLHHRPQACCVMLNDSDDSSLQVQVSKRALPAHPAATAHTHTHTATGSAVHAGDKLGVGP